MRALLDTNILISFLLTPESGSPIAGILRRAYAGEFTLILPQELQRELARKIREKRYLAERITLQQGEEFVALLSEVSEVIPAISSEIPAVTQDPKDDYLLAYAVVGEADYLVTGDDHLLSLPQVAEVRIVTAPQFADILARR